MTDLDKLEAVAKAATQGEWTTYVSGLPEYKNVSHGIEIGPEGALVADFQRKEDCDFVHAAQPATILDLIASARRDAEEIERLREAWKLCEEMVKAEDDLIADLVNDERYLDAMKMDFPITNRMRSMLARAAHTGEG